jgi:HemY protein
MTAHRQKHRSTAEGLPPVAGRASRKKLIAVCIAAFVVLIGAGAGAHFAWQWYRLPQRIEQALGNPPDLTGGPEILRERVDKALQLTRDRKTALDGVAELGRLYHANGFRTEAETCWRILRREQPAEARWAYYLADLRRLASDYVELASLLTEIVEQAPDYAPALLQLGEIEFKRGNTDRAALLYRRRLALLPDDPYAGLGLARVAIANQQRDEARRLLAKICRDVPTFSSSHNLYAEILAADGDEKGAHRHRWIGREAGRFREAADPWLEELQAWCFDARRLRILATIAYQTGEIEKGLSLLLRAVELAPENREGLETLGDLYLRQNQPERARDTLLRSLEVNDPAKPSPRTFVNLSQALRNLKQPDEALAATERGLARVGEAFEIHDAKGVALAELGRREDAIKAFEAALALRPNDANTNFNLALNLLALDRFDEAYSRLKQSLTLEPTFAKTLMLLTELEIDRGRMDVAEEFARQLYEAQPGMPRAQQLLGGLYLRSGTLAQERGDVSEAEKLYRKSVEVDPEGAESHASLGVLLLIQQRFTEAIAPLETYRRLKPDRPQSSLYLGQAYASVRRVPEARRILEEGRAIAERTGNKKTAENCRMILEQL